MNFLLMTCDLVSGDELLTMCDNILNAINWAVYLTSQ